MTLLNDVLLAMEGRDNLAEVSTFPPCMHTLIPVRTQGDTHPLSEDCSIPFTWSMTLMASLMLIF